jgi:hypothetical protein
MTGRFAAHRHRRGGVVVGQLPAELQFEVARVAHGFGLHHQAMVDVEELEPAAMQRLHPRQRVARETELAMVLPSAWEDIQVAMATTGDVAFAGVAGDGRRHDDSLRPRIFGIADCHLQPCDADGKTRKGLRHATRLCACRWIAPQPGLTLQAPLPGNMP